MKKLFTKILFIPLGFLLFISCDAVKKVNDDELLLQENTIEVDGEETSENVVFNQLIQQPNTKLFSFPIALHFYNMANEAPDSTHQAWLNKNPKREKRLIRLLSKKQVDEIGNYRVGLSNWIKKTGEAPVIIKEDRTERSRERIEEYYKSIGWLNAKATYSVEKDTTKEKRASVHYSVTRAKPYTIDSISVKIDSPVVDSLFQTTKHKSLIKPGEQYSRNNFADERDRITIQFRNSGLYHFNQEYVTFVADTNQTNHKVHVEYIISDRDVQTADTTKQEPFKIFKISRVNIITDYSFQNRDEIFSDSVTYNGYHLYSFDKMRYRPKAITDAVFIEPGSVFKDVDRTLTYNHLSELRVFRYPNINYTEDPADTTDTSLIANILLTPRKKFAVGVDVDASTSNIQEFGIGFSTSFLSRNVFRGAETLEVSARGSVGSSKDAADSDSKFFNISEVGGDIRLGFPRILFPLNTEGVIPKYMSPYTNLILGASSQRNIGLDKQNINAILNYKWTPSRIHTYRLDLLNIQYVRNLNTNNYFNVYRNSFNRLNNIALDSNVNTDPSYFDLDENGVPERLQIPGGADSFLADFRNDQVEGLSREQIQILRNINQQKERLTENNLIFATNISWIRDSRQSVFDNQFSRLRFKLEFAGNALAAISTLTDASTNENDNYQVLGVTYSQYGKFETEYIRHWEINKQTVVAMRLFGGLAVPYGNSNSIPFTRSYFAGGPNDNRGWLPFRLGPGSSDRGDEFNEANMKIGINAEYRFTILGSFKGAFFADAGNIWNTLDNVTDEPAVFDEFSDLRDIAVASGFGLRYDFGFFVFRLDFGFKTYDPAKELGQRWFKDYNFKNTVLNIGINYPF